MIEDYWRRTGCRGKATWTRSGSSLAFRPWSIVAGRLCVRDLAQMAMTPKWTQWAEEVLLPLQYWQEQLRRTRCREQKAQIALVLQAAEEAFERHPCTWKLTPEVLAGWKAGR